MPCIKRTPTLATPGLQEKRSSGSAEPLSNSLIVNQSQARFIDPGHVDDAIVAAEDLYGMYEAKLARLRVFIVQLKTLQAANDDVARALWRDAS